MVVGETPRPVLAHLDPKTGATTSEYDTRAREMTTEKSAVLEAVFAKGLFDPQWYLSAYPDVAALEMDPAYHFRAYGFVMGRAANATHAGDPYAAAAAARPVPPKGRELLAAHEIARTGEHNLGLSYARLHVPPHLSHTIETLRANAALARGDQQGWLAHLNCYLDHFHAAPVRLRDGARLIDRFATASLPEVTGGPLVSVIMPAWNAQTTIRAAAGSILAQTWRNLELLIIDDASEDSTWAALQEIAAADSRVKIFRNKINVGPYVSKNIALSAASGEWITGHDADDWAHPQRLEHHLRALSQSATPPRASVTFMIRLEADGMMDRFAPISDYSLDGIARDSAIACTFKTDFLRDTLGSWDCVRFGADSELISRTQAVIGDEFTKFPQISMLCMNLEGSLTNHATHGVDRTAGPSQIRRDYSAAWMKWHKALKDSGSPAKLVFPRPKGQNRPFPAPDAATVPMFKVRRNYAALTGKDPVCDEAVTAICPSKRPWFAERVAQMLKAQTHPNLHVIYVAHGPGHDIEAVRRVFEGGLQSVTVLELPDAEAPLGAALNLALDHCQTDLVAKIDDDDFYGPNYIRSAVAALRYNGFESVGVVGKERAYCYVEEMDVLALRYSASHENSLRTRVFGGTIFWSRKALQDQRYIPANTGEDSAFFREAAEKGLKIFSAEASDYIHLRYAAKGAHTWNVEARDFLKPASVQAQGLRIDLAYSSREIPMVSQIPSRTRVTKENG